MHGAPAIHPEIHEALGVLVSEMMVPQPKSSSAAPHTAEDILGANIWPGDPHQAATAVVKRAMIAMDDGSLGAKEEDKLQRVDIVLHAEAGMAGVETSRGATGLGKYSGTHGFQEGEAVAMLAHIVGKMKELYVQYLTRNTLALTTAIRRPGDAVPLGSQVLIRVQTTPENSPPNQVGRIVHTPHLNGTGIYWYHADPRAPSKWR